MPSKTKTPEEPQPLTGSDKVEAWRLECLLRAGWTTEHAEVIAISDVDLHKACVMVQQGCSSALAFAILS